MDLKENQFIPFPVRDLPNEHLQYPFPLRESWVLWLIWPVLSGLLFVKHEFFGNISTMSCATTICGQGKQDEAATRQEAFRRRDASWTETAETDAEAEVTSDDENSQDGEEADDLR